uniref:Lectin n=1 Tax=Nemopilema nomurai TaxID=321803 RepID=D4QD85_9CNID|nr:lectin [Nemopilema nomurai]
MMVVKIFVLLLFDFAFHLDIAKTALLNKEPVIQVKPIPRSCLDYLKDGKTVNGYYSIAGKTVNGYYSIAGPNQQPLTVFCDFTSEPGAAWTLVLSWALKYNNIFRTATLTVDMPVNKRTPNWVAYRLSRAQMLSIKAQSTHWRSTCSFNTHGVDLIDYVRANFNSIDITSFLGSGVCRKVEYINIRGQAASHKTVRFWQVLNTYALHIDSYYSQSICQFGAKQGSVVSEDNFGYHATVNKNFRCTAGQWATTQYWFGGYA